MNLKNIIRMQAVIIGVGAALLFAGSARSQEIENTQWPEGPNTVAVDSQATGASANGSNPVTVPAVPTAPAAASLQSVAAGQAEISSSKGWVLGFSTMCLVLAFVAYLRQQSKDGRQSRGDRTRKLNDGVFVS